MKSQFNHQQKIQEHT